MIRMTLAEAAAAMTGVLRGDGAAVFSGVVTDTRKPVAGALFVALKGANHDGHDHAAAALAAGAIAVVVARDDDTFGPARIVVDDTLVALGRLATAWRLRNSARVVAVTGNSGKTTTREFVAAVLREGGETLATQGNLNNEIGTPMTLLQLDSAHRYAVIEMGQGHPGDIACLVGMARPEVALVTNVTGAHLAGFGTLDAIADGKGEVYAQLPPDGTAIINADDAYAARWRASLPSCRVLTFGFAAGSDISASGVSTGDDGCARFTLHVAGQTHAVTLAAPGLHNVSNAMAAAAAGMACGIAPARIAAALATVTAVSGRLVVRNLADGTRLVDDTYNANPGSVKAAINTLASFAGTRLLVLGHMAELGADAGAMHRDVGAHARAAGVDALLVTGDFANETAAGFGAGAQVFGDVDALVAALRPRLGDNTTVLVKGSRSARMERVVAALTGEKHAALAH
jgi:UDP-N-acetylmuramoyl-tripeptide--D-alanyl-D-alanine ligase